MGHKAHQSSSSKLQSPGQTQLLSSPSTNVGGQEEYIWFRGGNLNGFCDIRPFMMHRGWDMSPGDPRSVSLDKSFHKEQE